MNEDICVAMNYCLDRTIPHVSSRMQNPNELNTLKGFYVFDNNNEAFIVHLLNAMIILARPQAYSYVVIVPTRHEKIFLSNELR